MVYIPKGLQQLVWSDHAKGQALTRNVPLFDHVYMEDCTIKSIEDEKISIFYRKNNRKLILVTRPERLAPETSLVVITVAERKPDIYREEKGNTGWKSRVQKKKRLAKKWK